MAELDLSPPSCPPEVFTSRRPGMSITLPRNFAPIGLDGSAEPKTPDQTFAEATLPPPPHHSTVRLRRRRINMDDFQARNAALPATLFASDIPVPSSAVTQHSTSLDLPSTWFAADVPLLSIEAPPPTTAGRPPYHHSHTEPSPTERFKIPAYRNAAPQTPPAQTKVAPPESRPSAWEMQRSSSASSLRSDSSLSSYGTFASRPTSFGGSATSPETDTSNPFSPHKIFVTPDTPSRPSKKIRTSVSTSQDLVRWTIAMDNHLFNVYHMYLGDPTVTPFKSMPGSTPPSGVCHRVARRAKQLWPKASKISRPIIMRYKLRNVMDEAYAVRQKTPEPNDFLKGKEPDDSSPSARWPSESSTRKRLRQLCKEKFTISAHYQRLRESRSPSPFTDAASRRSSSRVTRSMSRQLERHEETQPSASYATRELGISLVASGATAPLAQLVTGDSPESRPLALDRSEEWFNTPIGSSHQDVSSPPSGLGISHTTLGPPAGIPRLASPFNYSTWNGPTATTSDRRHRREISQNQFDTIHATGSRLLSPVRFEPDTSSNVNKRRAQHNLEDELSPSGSHLDQLSTVQKLVFTGAGDISQRRIRLRNRGATLGSSQQTLASLFTPPLSSGQTVSTAPLHSSGLQLPEADASQKRLGSPFELDENKRSMRNRTPRHVPSMSDPFISTTATPGMETPTPSQSIGERLAQFARLRREMSGNVS